MHACWEAKLALLNYPSRTVRHRAVFIFWLVTQVEKKGNEESRA